MAAAPPQALGVDPTREARPSHSKVPTRVAVPMGPGEWLAGPNRAQYEAARTDRGRREGLHLDGSSAHSFRIDCPSVAFPHCACIQPPEAPVLQ